MVAVPRLWLVVLTALVVVPWLVAAALYVSRPEAVEAPARSAPSLPSEAANRGAWGKLTLTPIIVSPPLEYVAADWGRPEEPDRWYFPSTSPDLLATFLTASGVSPAEVARLRASARPEPRIGGLVVSPAPDLVNSLAPDVRARIYLKLAETQLNFDQANSFRFLGATPEDWFGGSMISPQTRQLIEPLIYSDGDFLNFADVELIRSQITDRGELQRLAKTLLRQSTLLVRLAVNDASDVEDLADYWGTGGRRIDLRPLLESVVGAGPDRSIDIVHLLPTFARLHLYRYPKITTADLARPLLANCLWTSLNFFDNDPDHRFLDVKFALDTLRRSYYVVEHDYQLGDIVAFVDDEGDVYHVAVYIADDLVFTKNGTSPMAPWIIVRMDHVKSFYKRREASPRLIFHRRNEF